MTREVRAGSGGPTMIAAVERREGPPRLSVRLANGRDFRGRLGTELAIPSRLGAGYGQAGPRKPKIAHGGPRKPPGVSRRSIPSRDGKRDRRCPRRSQTIGRRSVVLHARIPFLASFGVARRLLQPDIRRARKAPDMDAPNPSSQVTYANRTPLRIGSVGLKARDLSRLADFYHQALGLQVIDRDAKSARLGAGGVTLLELESAPSATPDDPRTAGLYHTAFLQPTRGDLGRWLVHAARNRVALTGASDHLVSEAI